MQILSQMHCTACDQQIAPMSEEAIKAWHPQVPAWQVVEEHDIHQLVRHYTFDDFAQALAFATTIGALAETESHHPSIDVEWGKVTVRWWTHKVQGLHLNDFVMAAKTEAAYRRNPFQAMDADMTRQRWEDMRQQVQ
jgi:4a-hydroxytetrahydrobiopterin dehydratase